MIVSAVTNGFSPLTGHAEAVNAFVGTRKLPSGSNSRNESRFICACPRKKQAVGLMVLAQRRSGAGGSLGADTSLDVDDLRS